MSKKIETSRLTEKYLRNENNFSNLTEFIISTN